jgi:hypothetical protein
VNNTPNIIPNNHIKGYFVIQYLQKIPKEFLSSFTSVPPPIYSPEEIASSIKVNKLGVMMLSASKKASISPSGTEAPLFFAEAIRLSSSRKTLCYTSRQLFSVLSVEELLTTIVSIKEGFP